MSSTETESTNLDDFGLFDPAVQQCPHAYYAKMRSEQPLFPADRGDTEVLIVTRHQDVVDLVLDAKSFSSHFDLSGIPVSKELIDRMRALYKEKKGYPRVHTMLTADQPEHTRYRKLVNKAFTPRAINGLAPEIRRIASNLADGVEGGPVNFVEAFAVPLPMTAIARALNVPDDRLIDFKRWSDDAIAGIGTDISDDRRVEAESSVIEFQHYFAEQLEARRSDPSDDILSNLLNARIDKSDGDLGAEALTMSEMLSIIQQLLVAGNETTTKVLTETIRLLAEHPDQWQQLRDDPSRARQVAEEAIRLSTPTQGMYRVATADTRIGDFDVTKGTSVIAMFASANRDEQVFNDPNTFNPDREGLTNHIAFGKGIHYCLGANLARLELVTALEELSGRYSSVSLTENNNFPYDASFMLRGLQHLEVVFETAP